MKKNHPKQVVFCLLSSSQLPSQFVLVFSSESVVLIFFFPFFVLIGRMMKPIRCSFCLDHCRVFSEQLRG
jgi:hypothetical protein